MYPAGGCALASYRDPRRSDKKFRTSNESVPYLIQSFKKDELKYLLFQGAFENNKFLVDEVLKKEVDINVDDGEVLYACLHPSANAYKMADYLLSLGLKINDKHLWGFASNKRATAFLLRRSSFNNHFMEISLYQAMRDMDSLTVDVVLQKGVKIANIERMKRLLEMILQVSHYDTLRVLKKNKKSLPKEIQFMI